MNPNRTIYAKWILPVEGEPIEDGVIEIVDDLIHCVRPQREREFRSDKDAVSNEFNSYANTLVIPGLVNAHTHLEFSDLKFPIGAKGIPFPDWISQVIRWRIEQQQSDETLIRKQKAIENGLRESYRWGIAALGEIASAPWPIPHNDGREKWPLVRFYLEQLGATQEQSNERLTAVRARLDDIAPNSFSFGLSPHAPYSVSPDLFHGLLELARTTNCPLAMHLAESKEELQFLSEGTGPFADLFEKLGLLRTNEKRLTLDESCDALAARPGSLLIHGNYLNSKLIARIAKSAEHVQIVFCPRTHLFFAHEPYPLQEFLSHGISICIGTDSRASTPDLDLLKDLRSIAESFPDFPLEEILKMGTLNGATALGFDTQLGSLATGKIASTLAIELDSPIGRSPYEALFSGKITRRTWI